MILLYHHGIINISQLGIYYAKFEGKPSEVVMKYLFLDVDGVLNTPSTRAHCGPYIGIDDAKVRILKNIIEQTGAVIILHSTWKKFWKKPPEKYMQDGLADYLDKKLRTAGLVIADKTPDYDDEKRFLSRGEGIVEYLNARAWESFVILDDLQFDYDGCGLTDYFVKTELKRGLTEELAGKAVRILERKGV